MEKQYGLDSGGDISFLPFGHYVSKRVKEYCGNVVLVQKTNESSVEVKTNYDMLYNFAFSAIEEVYPKEEGKMEFTKDMLKSGEHVVTLRNNYRYLYLNGCFINLSSAKILDIYSEDLRNIGGIDGSEYDVMAVYEARRYTCFSNIILNSDKLIWKRDEEPIEIPSSEAFAKLREIYGKEVKIVEDKDD